MLNLQSERRIPSIQAGSPDSSLTVRLSMAKIRRLSALLFLSFFLSALLPACKTGSSEDPNRPFVAFISNNDHEFWTIAERGTQAAANDFNVRVEFKKPPGGGT